MSRTLTNEPMAPTPVLLKQFEARPRPRNFFIALITSRKIMWTLVVAALVIAIIGIPYVFWLMAPDLDLKLAIVDKTAAHRDLREHRGLYWLLWQNKFVDSRFTGKERLYDFRKDYFGFQPIKPPKDFTTSLLTAEQLSQYDALYLCDTYGVYTADYEQFNPEEIAATIHSTKIFGGLEPEEVDAIEQFARDGKLIIGEFNSFASPTPPELRARMEQLFGAHWTGWIGRYFLDFQDERDVPAWLYHLYAKQYGKQWDIRGSGYMLCCEEAHEFFILHDEVDVLEDGLQFVPMPEFATDTAMQGVEPSKYNFWFDIVEPLPGAEVLACYEFNLTPDGQAKVFEHKLAMSMPAIVRKRDAGYPAYYFAGDFVDFNKAMGPPNNRWTLYINRSYNRNAAPGGQGRFYYHTYYPLVSNILRGECNARTGQPERVNLFK